MKDLAMAVVLSVLTAGLVIGAVVFFWPAIKAEVQEAIPGECVLTCTDPHAKRGVDCTGWSLRCEE
jgi:hypothetical protein